MPLLWTQPLQWEEALLDVGQATVQLVWQCLTRCFVLTLALWLAAVERKMATQPSAAEWTSVELTGVNLLGWLLFCELFLKMWFWLAGNKPVSPLPGGSLRNFQLNFCVFMISREAGFLIFYFAFWEAWVRLEGAVSSLRKWELLEIEKQVTCFSNVFQSLKEDFRSVKWLASMQEKILKHCKVCKQQTPPYPDVTVVENAIHDWLGHLG